MEHEPIEIKETQDVGIISIIADFTTAMEKAVENTYQELCRKGYKKILIQFHPDYHITSGGIAILIGLLNKSQLLERQISITGLSEHFIKTFQMVGISRYTTIYSSLDEALQEMSEQSKSIEYAMQSAGE